ncbi:MAG: hypothetical protein ABFD92_21655 [Planctomycetaceae bacterium]
MTAELHPAFVWDCDSCGTENFTRVIEGNLDEAAFQAIADRDQVVEDFLAPNAEQQDDGSYSSAVLINRITLVPKHVTCRECGATHETEILREDGG